MIQVSPLTVHYDMLHARRIFPPPPPPPHTHITSTPILVIITLISTPDLHRYQHVLIMLSTLLLSLKCSNTHVQQVRAVHMCVNNVLGDYSGACCQLVHRIRTQHPCHMFSQLSPLGMLLARAQDSNPAPLYHVQSPHSPHRMYSCTAVVHAVNSYQGFEPSTSLSSSVIMLLSAC